MESAKYIYLQISQEIHNDRPRILTESENVSTNVYLDGLTKDEMVILNQYIDLINQKLTDKLNMKF